MADLCGPRNHVFDRSSYGCHLANVIKLSMLDGNATDAAITVAMCVSKVISCHSMIQQYSLFISD